MTGWLLLAALGVSSFAACVLLGPFGLVGVGFGLLGFTVGFLMARG